jgi:GT2 family glycosyltransferase
MRPSWSALPDARQRPPQIRAPQTRRTWLFTSAAEKLSPATEHDPRYCLEVDIVVVAYGARDRLGRCLQSLKAHPPSRPHHVTVVDNGCDPRTEPEVKSILRTATVIAPRANLGFTRAVNIGIRRGSSEYVLLLNPDTEVYAGALDRLAGVLDLRPEVAVVGPRLVRPDGSFDHAARRSFPTILGAAAHLLGIGRLVNRGPLAQYRAPHVEAGPVDAINGAFMLARRSALESIGLLDKGYWMYMEDLDLLYRLKQAGWLTWYEPAALALHVKRGTTAGLRSPRLVWAFHYGMFRFYRTHYAPQRGAAVNGLVYTGIAARGAGVLAWSVTVRPALKHLAPGRRGRAGARRVPIRPLIESGENAGFARATNRGIAAGSAPQLLALNPDRAPRRHVEHPPGADG